MIKIVPRIVLVAMALFISALVEGRVLHPKDVKMHPSGDAVYVVGSACTVSDAPATEEGNRHYHELLEWCEKARAATR